MDSTLSPNYGAKSTTFSSILKVKAPESKPLKVPSGGLIGNNTISQNTIGGTGDSFSRSHKLTNEQTIENINHLADRTNNAFPSADKNQNESDRIHGSGSLGSGGAIVTNAPSTSSSSANEKQNGSNNTIHVTTDDNGSHSHHSSSSSSSCNNTTTSSYQNNGKIISIFNSAESYLKSTGQVDALAVLQENKDKISMRDIGKVGGSLFSSDQGIVLDDNLFTSNSNANSRTKYSYEQNGVAVLLQQISHLVDDKKDKAAGKESDNSVQEETNALMMAEGYLDSVHHGQFSEKDDELKTKLAEKVRADHAGKNLAETAYGDEVTDASTEEANCKMSDTLKQAVSSVEQFLQANGNTDAYNLLEEYKSKGLIESADLDRSQNGYYESNKDGTGKIVINNYSNKRSMDVKTSAEALIHELTHALDDKKDAAAGQAYDNSIQEETSAIMAEKDYNNFFLSDDKKIDVAGSREAIAAEVRKTYAQQGLAETAYGDYTIGTTSSIAGTTQTTTTETEKLPDDPNLAIEDAKMEEASKEEPAATTEQTTSNTEAAEEDAKSQELLKDEGTAVAYSLNTFHSFSNLKKSSLFNSKPSFNPFA